MQWDGSRNAGFSTGAPWLPLDPHHATRNVEALSRDAMSILTLYKRLIRLRSEHLALSVGSYVPVAAHEDVLAYDRSHAGQTLAVILNMSHEERRIDLPERSVPARVVLSTHLDREGEPVGGQVVLRADEGMLLST
jgi:alpha-glucosidase